MPLPPPVDIPALICSVSWPCQEALLVVYGPTWRCRWGESGGKPDAVSEDGQNLGLFQVNVSAHAWRVGGDVSLLLDAAINIAVAHDIWLDAGESWSPWGCRPD